jgi:hypothetical protein
VSTAGPPHGPGETQLLVRATMLQAGGYWRPLAAVARLLEELGELAELLDEQDPASADVGSEVADLWIITTALADQYLAHVPEPSAAAAGLTGREDKRRLSDVVQAAGVIARVVNHYDGPKTPRGSLPPLAVAIDAFHGELGRLARTMGIDLADAVADKLQTIRSRGDLTRFQRSGHDPSTTDSLARYRAGEPGREHLRLWGAPEWDGVAAPAAAAVIEPWLDAFAKAAVAERLEGFVIPGPIPNGDAGTWTARLLEALGAEGGRVVRQGLQMDATVQAGDEVFLLLMPSSSDSS